MGAKIAPPPGHGPYCFRIHGQIHHYVGPGNGKTYSSVYFMDTDQAIRERLRLPVNSGCNEQTMRNLTTLINDVNPYAS
jgi:hypothetical protein